MMRRRESRLRCWRRLGRRSRPPEDLEGQAAVLAGEFEALRPGRSQCFRSPAEVQQIGERLNLHASSVDEHVINMLVGSGAEVNEPGQQIDKLLGAKSLHGRWAGEEFEARWDQRAFAGSFGALVPSIRHRQWGLKERRPAASVIVGPGLR